MSAEDKLTQAKQGLKAFYGEAAQAASGASSRPTSRRSCRPDAHQPRRSSGRPPTIPRGHEPARRGRRRAVKDHLTRRDQRGRRVTDGQDTVGALGRPDGPLSAQGEKESGQIRGHDRLRVRRQHRRAGALRKATGGRRSPRTCVGHRRSAGRSRRSSPDEAMSKPSSQKLERRAAAPRRSRRTWYPPASPPRACVGLSGSGLTLVLVPPRSSVVVRRCDVLRRRRGRADPAAMHRARPDRGRLRGPGARLIRRHGRGAARGAAHRPAIADSDLSLDCQRGRRPRRRAQDNRPARSACDRTSSVTGDPGA